MSQQSPEFLDLLSAFPARTSLLSIVPVLLALAVGVNGLWHGVNPGYVVAFGLAMAAYAVGSTRHQLSAFHVRSLEDRFFDDD